MHEWSALQNRLTNNQVNRTPQISDLVFDVSMGVMESEIPLTYSVPKVYASLDGIKGDIACDPPPGTVVGEGDAEVKLLLACNNAMLGHIRALNLPAIVPTSFLEAFDVTCFPLAHSMCSLIYNFASSPRSIGDVLGATHERYRVCSPHVYVYNPCCCRIDSNDSGKWRSLPLLSPSPYSGFRGAAC